METLGSLASFECGAVSAWSKRCPALATANRMRPRANHASTAAPCWFPASETGLKRAASCATCCTVQPSTAIAGAAPAIAAHSNAVPPSSRRARRTTAENPLRVQSCDRPALAAKAAGRSLSRYAQQSRTTDDGGRARGLLARDLLAALDGVLLVDRGLVVLAGAAVDRLGDAVGGPDRVVARPAIEDVFALPAHQQVVALAAVQRFVAGVAEELVVPREPKDRVVAG